MLKWKPKTSLQEGLLYTYDYFSKLTLAVCLPLTSKGCRSLSDVKERLKNLVLDVSSHVFIGVDDDDPLYNLPEVNKTWFEHILNRPCHIRRFTKLESKKRVAVDRIVPYIYGMYNLLINDAYDAGMEYFVLWGDDIKITNDNWLPNVAEKFRKYGLNGVGVVALKDLTSPGMPTFPVVNRTHVEVFNGFCPKNFINQDADPWVFAVYRRFNCASYIDVNLENEIGGTIETGVDARYERVHLENWRDTQIEPAVQKVADFFGIERHKNTVTLDVITPTYHTNLYLLENVIRLKDAVDFQADVTVRFIIVVDNPETEVKQKLKDLAQKYSPFVLLRFNSTNLGAGCTRNRGLDESDAEHVLFLDDDVDVAQNPELLLHYIEVIRKNKEEYCGFVGCTAFPAPKRIQEIGFIMSYCAFFWTVAERQKHPMWGVTANVCLKRSIVRFHDDFIKTGGGEDIQFCIDTRRHFGQELLGVKEALVIHPYWNNFSVKHFFNWTQGDGLLIDKYPEFVYLNYPTFPETCFLGMLVWISMAMFGFLEGGENSSQIWVHIICCVWFLYLIMVEFGMDLLHYFYVDSEVAADATGYGLCRVLGSLYATYTKNAVETGHLWVHLKRGKLHNLGKRFDWNCGTDRNAVLTEIKKARMRFFLNIIGPLILATLVP